MLRKVARDRAKACATLPRSLDVGATCALSTAMSVPGPMAIPTSAAAERQHVVDPVANEGDRA